MNNKNKWLFVVLTLVFIGAVVLWYYSPWRNVYEVRGKITEPNSLSIQEEVIIPVELQYGIPVDSFIIEEGRVRRNETLASILQKLGVSNQSIYETTQKGKGIFNPRRIVRGQKYTTFFTLDTISELAYLVYEEDKANFIVFQFIDSISVYPYHKKIDTVLTKRSGVITTSLYVDMMAQDASPLLVNDLADIFGWEIDFFRLNKGDIFKVIYNEHRIDSQLVGIGRIHGAYFESFGKQSYAVYFEQDSIGDYFDTTGNSLQKSLLKYPIKFSRISSRYTGRRYHPVLKRFKAHLGTDFAAPTGTPIRSVGTGIVEKAGYTRGNGNYVKIRHNSTYTTGYLHMSRIAKGIRSGVKVKQGQLIGYVGSTGLATGPHLCYRFWKHGTQVDALKVDLPPANPVKKDNLSDYKKSMNEMRAELDEIEVRYE